MIEIQKVGGGGVAHTAALHVFFFPFIGNACSHHDGATYADGQIYHSEDIVTPI